MNYYEHHIGDYAAATGHLSLIEDAVYTRMLRRYYLTECHLPPAVQQVMRLVGARLPDECAAVEAVLREFFTLADDGWHQKRADEDIAKFHEKRAKAQSSAAARWADKPSDSERNANAMRTHTERNAHQSPDTRHHKDQEQDQKRARTAPSPSDLFPDVDPDHLRDWIAARKAKRLPLTETAAKGFRRTAAKAGMTAAEAVKFCAEKGWAGLYAEHVGTARGSPQGGQQSKTLTAIQTLQGMKHGHVDSQRDSGRSEPPALLGNGSDASG